MSRFTNIISNINFLSKKNLAATPAQKEAKKRTLPYTVKSISTTRKTIADWNTARNSFLSEEPKNYPIQLLYLDILTDALLTSQIENRQQLALSMRYTLKNAAGDDDEEQTLLLRNLPASRKITKAMLDANNLAYSLIELSLGVSKSNQLTLDVFDIPRTNVVPQTGLFYPDFSEDTSVKYREMAEFGTYILEFNSEGLGLLNKAIPHVLLKRFAQSCWSELCEIYGIPPRVMTTNTQDPVQLNRAEQMMKDMGAAAWFIIDETEKFEWAQGVATNGDVYKNLINLCSNELSLLISGAIIGQDTVNGNRSKDESAQEMLGQLVTSDLAYVEACWNTIVIPALINLGILKGDVRFEFAPSENIEQLWKRTAEALKYMTVDTEWVKSKFGIEVTGEREVAKDDKKEETEKLNADFNFFV